MSNTKCLVCGLGDDVVISGSCRVDAAVIGMHLKLPSFMFPDHQWYTETKSTELIPFFWRP